MPLTGLDAEQNARLANSLVDVRDRLHTPADLGTALLDYILTEATTQGTLKDDGSQIELEFPLKATITLPQPAAGEPTSHDVTTSICVDALGYHLVCISFVIHETTS